MGAAGATLLLGKLDELIDAVKGGKPDMLLMSRRSRRKINALVRADGGMTETDRDQFGNFVQLWDSIPVAVNDWILDTHVVAGSVETAITGGTSSVIYAVQFGEGALLELLKFLNHAIKTPPYLQVRRRPLKTTAVVGQLLASLTTCSNAFGSLTARSARILRSRLILDFFSPFINAL